MKGNSVITTGVYPPPIVSLMFWNTCNRKSRKTYTLNYNSEVVGTKVQYLHVGTNSESVDGTGS